MPDGDANASYPAYNGISPVGRTRRSRRHPALALLLLLLLGSLDRRQGDGIDDIVNQCATGQVVHRLAHTLQHRPDGDQVGRTLYRFVGGVTGVQIRENEHGSATRNRRVRRFDFATSAMTAASYCNGPSIIRSGRFPAPDASLHVLSLRRCPRQRCRWSRRALPHAVRCRRQWRNPQTESRFLPAALQSGLG